jgi:hypothetical protein
MSLEKITVEIELCDISSVKPNPDNPRVIKDRDFKKLLRSIKGFSKMMQLNPIKVDKDLMILAGNQRLAACKEAGWKKIPIINVSSLDLSPEEEKEFIIKDNTHYGSWEYNILGDKWGDLPLDEWNAIPDNDFDPNLTPNFSSTEVSTADINDAQDSKGEGFQQTSSTLRVTCPHCAEDFDINNPS